MNWNAKSKQRFLQAILSLETESEAKNFLRDLLTPQEIEEFSKRLEAAELLSSKTSYITIEKRTGLSSTTIARVSKYLNGSANGYKAILSKLHHNNSSPMRRELS